MKNAKRWESLLNALLCAYGISIQLNVSGLISLLFSILNFKNRLEHSLSRQGWQLDTDIVQLSLKHPYVSMFTLLILLNSSSEATTEPTVLNGVPSQA
ncbi:hypothetical protein, partial [Vibrio parahaemolyticus]|uniref:hypothetical protein n=1 Tax=Vibrio parahaemolyticus TaxID=670 RepID=UPI001A8EB988